MKYQFLCKADGVYLEGPSCGTLDKAVRGLKRLTRKSNNLEIELVKDNEEELTDEETKAANSKILEVFGSVDNKIVWSKIREY